jgi:UDP-N-acetylglucosamine--N-acetylmuramyl-(pentapeptide) pyrophosphoryl-undecaprenol N-acetylglucosamine transferase
LTDARAAKHAGAFPPEAVHVIPSATFRSRSPLAVARTGSVLGYGLLKAWLILPRQNQPCLEQAVA